MQMKLIIILISLMEMVYCEQELMKQCAPTANSYLLTPQGIEKSSVWNDTVQKDIIDGKLGIPLHLVVNVLDVNTCLPVRGAVVDLWQCDAVGTCPNSIAAGPGHRNAKASSTSFLQDQQITDENGAVSFDTIYPGWNIDRAPHIQVKVHIGTTSSMFERAINSKDDDISYTGQLYFDDRLTDQIAKVFPYSTNNIRRTRNDENASTKILSIRRAYTNKFTEGLKTEITLGIDPTARLTIQHKTAKMDEQIVTAKRKRIAVVAHDNKKTELINCLKQHRETLSQHELFGTGTTGSLVEKELDLPVTKFKSGPLGGDQQIGAKIASLELDMLLFLIDPLYAHPHNADIQALLRLSEVWNIACATTVTSIDFILTSPKMNESYTRYVQLTPPKSEHKPTTIQTRRIPTVNDNLNAILSRLISKRRR